MAYTATQIRAVRLLIPDVEAIYGDAGNEHIFEDSDIEVFLEMGRGNAAWAAGLASLSVGGSEALIQKVIRNYETQTDGAKLMLAWNQKGHDLIAVGKAEIDAEDVGIFEIAFPDWGEHRHPEGQTHGSYRGIAPTGWQW